MPPLGLPIYGQPAPPSGSSPRWRSLAEAAGATDAAAGSDPDGDQPAPESLGRRSFMQLLGASAALAGLSACKPPREQVVSYVRRPAGVTPSLPGYYATALSRGGHAVGVVVETHEGRPTKIEGNREQGASLGGAGLHELAAILDLYEPSRLAGIRRHGRQLAWSTFLQETASLAAALEKDGGARLRVLAEPTSSPALADLRARLLARFPRARIDAWDPLAEDAAREGARLAMGRPLEIEYRLEAADVILSLDADFLATEGEHLKNARAFASRRTQASMNRLYQAEAGYSVTGGVADHRLRMRAAEVLPFARAVAAALAANHGVSALAALGAPAAADQARSAAAVARDLYASRGRGLVVAGRRQPAVLHALAAVLNAALGNAGTTVFWREPSLLDGQVGAAGLVALAREIAAGQVDTLVVTAWNPAYTAPADLGLAALLQKVPNLVYLASRADVTSKLAGTVVAAAHPFEAWGDLRGRDGTASIVQTLLAPLTESVSELDLLAAFTNQGHLGSWRLVREGWKARAGEAGFDQAWDRWLAAGVVADTARAPVVAAVDAAGVARALAAAPRPPAGLEACFAPDDKALDGRFADNAWLQELPHPISKLTWDNAALLSPATARRLGLADGDVVTLTLRGRSVEAPVMVQPGHADESVTLPLGYGRTVAGPVGQGIGFAAGALRHAAAPWIDGGLELKKAGRRHVLARTQEHFSMEGRAIAIGLTAAELPHAAHELDEHRGEQATILPAVDYSREEYRWGMSFDLSKCLGCGACTLACQAENNIPIVGKEQVLNSREMHWIRVDRYYEGTPEDPTSKVARLQQDERRYDLLHELGTRPRTAYLVRLKNPNPELA